jgi:alkylation response protein AidB-like acyl-CoA dehydrogenase
VRAAPESVPLSALPGIAPESDSTIDQLQWALEQLESNARELDASPRFPRESFASLGAAGVPQFAAERTRCDLASEIDLVRRVAAVDGSVARILDGHFNGVERLSLLAPGGLRERELASVADGTLIGVWGADPVGSEGAPAHIETTGDGSRVLRGVKTFCSGAGGVQRAVVVARAGDGTRRLAYIDTTVGLALDRSWYRASGLRASESHRVEFHDTPVLAILGERDELLCEPWFSRDAVRSAATWAGLADCLLGATLAAVRAGAPDDLRLHAVGRMRVAQASIERWLTHATRLLERPENAPVDAGVMATETRVAIADAARVILAESVRACGSRELVRGGTLDRARRDLELFLLQHRLDPKLVELGRLAVALEGP